MPGLGVCHTVTTACVDRGRSRYLMLKVNHSSQLQAGQRAVSFPSNRSHVFLESNAWKVLVRGSGSGLPSAYSEAVR